MSRLAGWLRQANAQGWVLALERASDPSAYLLARQKNIDHHVVTALTDVSYGYARLGELENAVKWADLAEEASLLGGTAQSQADVFVCRGSVLLSMADTRPREAASLLPDALESAEHALMLYQEADLLSGIPVALNLIAAIHDARGERIPALRNQIQCAISWSRVPRTTQAATPPAEVLAHIAGRYWTLEDTELEAGAELLEEHSQALLAEAASWDGQPELADMLDAIGDALETTGRPEDALDHWQRAASIYRHMGRAEDEYMVCRRMQVATFVMGGYEDARQHGERCAALEHAITDQADIAESLHQLAATYYQLTLIDLSISTYREAIERCRQSEESLVDAAGCLLELGVIEMEHGYFSQAKADLEQVSGLPLTQPHAWIAKSLLAELCWHKLGDPGTAIRYAEEAVSYSEAGMSPVVRARSLLLCGAAHLLAGTADVAFDRLRRTCQLLQETVTPEQLDAGAFYRHFVTPPALSQAALLASKAARIAGLRTESTEYFLIYSQACDQDEQPSGNEGSVSTAAAARRLVAAETEQEQRQVLENDQALLITPDADHVFGQLAVRASQAEDSSLAGWLQVLRGLLFEARIIGIPSAWTKFQASRERAAAAAREADRLRREAAQSSQGNTAEEPVREMDESERQALWKKYSTPNLKVFYDTGAHAMGGLSWGVTSSSERPKFRTTSLESWLTLTSFRDQRRFLEKHLELLGPESTRNIDQLRITLQRNAGTLLSIARRSPDDIAEALRDLRAHAELLDNVRARGGNVQAVRDAYVDAHGGFTADLPQWAEDVLARLTHLAGAQAGTGPRDTRAGLLREAVTRAGQDPAVAAETLAEFRNELGRTLARCSADPRQISAARSLHQQAQLAFGAERYPRQWLRTGLLEAEVEDELISLEPAASRRGHAERIEELMTAGARHLEAETWPPAALCFARVTRLAPDHVDAWLGLARACQQLKFFADALAACEAVIERAPDRADAWAVMGMLHVQQGQPADSLPAYQRAAALDPDDANLWFQLAGTLKSLGRHEEALDAYERALSCQPGHIPALHNKGDLLAQLSRHDEALAAYDHALSLAPSMFPTLANKGNVLLRLNRHEEALDCFNEALNQAPQFYPAWFGRGTALLFLGRNHEALLALEGAVTLNPDEASIFANLAVALAALGRESEAAGARRRAQAQGEDPR